MTADIGAVSRDTTFEVDREEVDLDADLGGTTAHLSLVSISGGQPNLRARTLQGINNNEVSGEHPRVYEAWLQRPFADGAVTLKVGLYDVNSEFDVSSAAGWLLAPAFGFGSEIAAAGPTGSATYPETALAVRLEARPFEGAYLRLAAVDAVSRTFGDHGGVDTRFGEGVMLIAEGGLNGDRQLALGVWRYSRRQPALFPMGSTSDVAQGVYLLMQRPLWTGGGNARVTGFLRAGVSDGRTSPFLASGRAGLLVEHAIAGRRDDVVTFGVDWGRIARGYADLTSLPQRDELQLEAAYVAQVGAHLQVQPDLQYSVHPGGRGDEGVWLATLRVTLTGALPR